MYSVALGFSHLISGQTLVLFPCVQGLVDVGVYLVCQRVEEGLRNHNTGPCLAFCNENRSKLRRLKSNLELQIRLQDFIEYVRSGRRLDAIK